MHRGDRIGNVKRIGSFKAVFSRIGRGGNIREGCCSLFHLPFVGRVGGNPCIHAEERNAVFTHSDAGGLARYLGLLINIQQYRIRSDRRSTGPGNEDAVTEQVHGRGGPRYIQCGAVLSRIHEPGNVVEGGAAIGAYLPLVRHAGGDAGIHGEAGIAVFTDGVVHRLGDDLGQFAYGQYGLVGIGVGQAVPADDHAVLKAVHGRFNVSYIQCIGCEIGVAGCKSRCIHVGPAALIHLPLVGGIGGHTRVHSKVSVILFTDDLILRVYRHLRLLVNCQERCVGSDRWGACTSHQHTVPVGVHG